MLFSPFGKKFHIFSRVGLTLALVINLTLPVFASDLTSGSAFAVDERLLASPRLATAAAAPVGSSTDPYYVRPFTNGSATVYRYTWSTSNSNGSSSGSNQSFTNFADIVTHITSSIANSFLALGQRLHYDNDAIYSRLFDILSAIPSSSDVSSIATGIQTLVNSGIAVDLSPVVNKLDFDWPWGFYNYYIDHPNVTLGRINSNGNYYSQSVYTKSQGWFGNMMYWMVEHVRNMAQGVSLIVGSVVNADDSDFPLTNSDLTTSVSAKKSVWYDFRSIGSNLSDHLAHLRYVLANDEDIALRQSQHDNMSTVTSDFTSGDVSVSPAKLGGLKSVGSALTDGFSSSASVSDGLSVLGSGSDAWDWFTEENAQSFDSVSDSRNSLRLLKSGTSYLDQYYKDVMPYVN